jgi:hypothetical protein
MEKKLNISINVDIKELSITTRNWLYKADEIMIGTVIEMGYKLLKEGNKNENIKLDMIIDNTKENMNDMKNMIISYNKIIYDNIKMAMEEKNIEHEIKKKTIQSSILGQQGENYAYNILSENFENVIDIHNKGHSGDYIINDKILIEIKNYATNVPKKEIEKFKKDLESTKKEAGVFWSLKSAISNIGNFKIIDHTINGKTIPIIYINTDQDNIIILAIKLLIYKIEINRMMPDANINIGIIIDRINELEQNLNLLITMRNAVKKMSENTRNSIDEILMQITTLEGTTKTNIEIIKKEINKIDKQI